MTSQDEQAQLLEEITRIDAREDRNKAITIKDAPTPITKPRVALPAADGQPIYEGSVLEAIDPKDDCRGVVTQIINEGDYAHYLMCVGDVLITSTAGQMRVSCQYANYRHVPREEQTYLERHQSWCHQEYVDSGIEEDQTPRRLMERKAIDGILALCPSDPVDWESGPWPDTIEEALSFMAKHLTGLTAVQVDEARVQGNVNALLASLGPTLGVRDE